MAAQHLVGTKDVRAYMHGFFIDTKLYRQLHALAKPFAYDEWRKAKQKEKQAAKLESRISAALPQLKKDLPKVNAKLAKKLLDAQVGPESDVTVHDTLRYVSYIVCRSDPRDLLALSSVHESLITTRSDKRSEPSKYQFIYQFIGSTKLGLSVARGRSWGGFHHCE